ncbi:MAG TPA: sugar ABC transporter ATP-binding protein [Spirochaeta sp.]|nr:sugar ABC transporter ATP-binding protein [Spirochaeta sp.]
MAELKLKGVKKVFDNVTAVDNLDLEIKDGEFFVLLGPTGAGKTTTLRMIAGLEKADSGEIILDDDVINALNPAERDIAMVFQYYTLYPHMSVKENLAFPLKSKRRNIPEEEIEERVMKAAKTLNIESKLERKPTELSGGEMQRVGIGRAIVRNPRMFLMDEPLSNLDAKLRESMRSELARLHIDMGETFIYVTHDQVEAMTMADRVGVLNEGRLLQLGTPDQIYNEPANIFVATFVGSPQINLLDAEVDGDHVNIPAVGHQMMMTASQKKSIEKNGVKTLLYGVRPEEISIVQKEEENCCIGKVKFKQSMGAEDILNIIVGSIILKAIVSPQLGIKDGDEVVLKVEVTRSHLFNKETGDAIR